MPSVNPGPAVNQSGQVAAVMAPFASPPSNPIPQGVAALRCIALYKNMPLSGLGDISIPVINVQNFAPATVAFGNALVNGVSGSVAAATLSINVGPAVTGNSIRGTGALTGSTSSVTFVASAAATPAVISTPTNGVIYANVTVAVAGGTIDVYVYGYDTSTFNYP